VIIMNYVNNLSWMIGGPQGSGVDSAATSFARAVASAGLWVFGNREYHSNIKGMHSYFRVRVSDKGVRSHVDPVHLLATFDRETALLHKGEVVAGGAILYDPTTVKPEEFQRDDVLRLAVPYADIVAAVAKEFGREGDAKRLMVMRNVISVAASLGLLELEFDVLEKVIREVFTGRRAKLAPMNVAAARRGYDQAREQWARQFPYKLEPIQQEVERILTNGTIAAGLGKLVGGCRFQTYYPITPASDESEFLEAHPEFGMAVVQTEDEIAAVTMATGAALTGVRASTSTSGPGFCLMAEGLGWAGMNEVPVVLFNYQRGGPSTGLPTRHEQGDLRFVWGAGHGDFPRLVLAPGDIEEYFYDSAEAFNLAERYQTPVIVLCDKALANSTQTVPAFDASAVTIDRGYLVPEGVAVGNGDDYRRFRFTEDGISPRAVLGQQGTLFWNTGDEHDEYGHITEDPENRVRMMDKRQGKLETAAREIPIEKKVSVFGDENADLTLVSWGSNKGAILDAMEVLRAQGIRINFLHIRLLSPFPADFVADFLKRAKQTVDVEMNYTAQLAELIRAKTGIALDRLILKWNGRPMSQDEIVFAVQRILRDGERKVVLTRGL